MPLFNLFLLINCCWTDGSKSKAYKYKQQDTQWSHHSAEKAKRNFYPCTWTSMARAIELTHTNMNTIALHSALHSPTLPPGYSLLCCITTGQLVGRDSWFETDPKDLHWRSWTAQPFPCSLQECWREDGSVKGFHLPLILFLHYALCTMHHLKSPVHCSRLSL